MSAQPVDVLEALAAWANEKDVGMAEWRRRAIIVDAVSELVEAARAVDANGHKRTCDPREGDYYRVKRVDFDALRAALARVQGDA